MTQKIVPVMVKWLPLAVIAFCLMLLGLNAVSASDINDEYLTEKIEIANSQDWGAYSEMQGTYLLILDEEPYTILIQENTAAFGSGVPELYDYKIITTKDDFDKWWKIAEYYLENGKFSWKQRYLEIPWLYINTPIQKFGSTGNIAYAIQGMQKTTVNII